MTEDMRALLERYRRLAEIEAETKERQVRETADSKAMMPANYWHAAYRAQMKYDLALRLAAALEEG